jgi:hypothetical protein
MSATGPKATRSLEDFSDLLEVLAQAGTEQVVIGGCAVGAYARLIGAAVTSVDLDLYANHANTAAILTAVAGAGGKILKRARARNVPVAVLDWKGRELNVLNASTGLQSPEIETQLAREFVLRGRSGLAVLIADPFELLANKLAVDRPKDRPHIAILRQFLDAEVVLAFREEEMPRKRIAPAARLLRVEKKRALPPRLMAELTKQARLRSDFRFLASHAPNRDAARAVLERAAKFDAAEEVREILRRAGRT